MGASPSRARPTGPTFSGHLWARRIAEALAETTIETLCRDAAEEDVPRAESEAPMYFI
jgi:hypothetical protein